MDFKKTSLLYMISLSLNLVFLSLLTKLNFFDSRTDKLIKKAIHEKFAQCTVVTITHRLSTITDSDMIMVRALPVEF